MPRCVESVLIGVVVSLGATGLTAVPSHAATITVNTTIDVINPDDRQCSLREAIIAANTNVASGPGAGECPKGGGGVDQIIFVDLPGSPDIYQLAIPPSGANNAQTGDLNITGDLIITGNGSPNFFQTETVIDGGHLDRVFRIGSGASVQLEVLTIRNGAVIDHGAGIANEAGTLVVRESFILDNGAACSFPGCAVSGAGLWNRGPLTIERSLIADNVAQCAAETCTAFGGGIFNDTGGILTLEDSVVFSNDARCIGEHCSARGGGIWNTESVVLVNGGILNNVVQCDDESVFSFDCTALGGGLFNAQGVVDVNSLVKGNRAECRDSAHTQTACRAEGGGLSNHLGVMTISESSVVENRARSVCALPPCGTGGGGRPSGGGIHNEGHLVLTGSSVSSNIAGCGKGECHARGGGLFSDPFFDTHTAIVSDSTFSENLVVSPLRAEGAGVNNQGRLEVERSTFDTNLAFGYKAVGGGGIASAGDARIVNSTVSVNLSACWGQACGSIGDPGGEGGGLYLLAPGSTDIAFTTLFGNSAFSPSSQAHGGGIAVRVDATLRIEEAIVASSLPLDCRVFGAPSSLAALGANLDTDGSCPGFTLPATNPLLDSLAFNGGPTATHALLAGSPAIDAAPNCLFGSNPVLVDQRNTLRPKGPACDLGAYERSRLFGGGGSGPLPPGLLRNRGAKADKAMCRTLRTLGRGLRVHERSDALLAEDADAIREILEILRADMGCPGVKLLPRPNGPRNPA